MTPFKRSAIGPLAPIILATCLVAVGPAEAQTPITVRAHVGASFLMPQGDLAYAPVLASPTNAFSFADFDASPAVSLGVEVGPAAFPARVRVRAARSFGNEEVGVWGCADAAGTPLPCPSILIEAPTDVTLTSVAADLVGSLKVGLIELSPLLGVGWVRYSYRWDPAPVGSFSLEPGNADDDSIALHYGAGVGVFVGTTRLDIEYSAYRTRADRLRPNDTRSVSLGLSVPLIPRR